MSSNTFRELLKQLDILGPYLGIEHNGSNRYKSHFGSFITLCIIVTCAVIGFMFGQEIYLRERPTLNYVSVTLPYSDVIIDRLDLQVGLYDLASYQPVFNIYNYLHFDIIYVTTPKDDYPILDSNKYHMVNNTDSNGDPVYIFNTGENYNNTISNELYSSNSSTFTVSVSRCRFDCSPDLEERLNSLALIFSYQTYSFEVMNYSNPITKSYTNKVFRLSSRLAKIIQIDFLADILESDIGWILENKKIEQVFKVGEIDIQYVLIDDNPEAQLLFIQLAAPQKITKIYRSYMKVQQLLALIGGLVNAIIIASTIIFSHYLRFSYINFINDLNNDNYNESIRLTEFIKRKFSNNQAQNAKDNYKKEEIQVSKIKNFSSQNCYQLVNSSKLFSNLAIIRSEENFSKDIGNNKPDDINASRIGNKYDSSILNLNIKSQANVNNMNLSNINNNNKDKDKQIKSKENNISDSKFKVDGGNNVKDSDANIGDTSHNNNDYENITKLSYLKYILSYVLCQSKQKKLYNQYIDSLQKALELKTYKVLLSQFGL